MDSVPAPAAAVAQPANLNRNDPAQASYWAARDARKAARIAADAKAQAELAARPDRSVVSEPRIKGQKAANIARMKAAAAKKTNAPTICVACMGSGRQGAKACPSCKGSGQFTPAKP